MHVQSYGFVYWPFIKKTCEWVPRLYIENVSRGHPPNPSQLKQVFIRESVDPFALAEDSALAYSDSLALTELSRLVKPSVYLEKSWLS